MKAQVWRRATTPKMCHFPEIIGICICWSWVRGRISWFRGVSVYRKDQWIMDLQLFTYIGLEEACVREKDKGKWEEKILNLLDEYQVIGRINEIWILSLRFFYWHIKGPLLQFSKCFRINRARAIIIRTNTVISSFMNSQN